MVIRHALTLLALGSLTACTPKPHVDEAAVFAALTTNLEAMQREDLDGVMATIHPKVPELAAIREKFADLFERHDLKYTLTSLKIARAKGEEVEVRFMQRTEHTGGEDGIEDNFVEGVHTLQKDGPTWKLLQTTALRVTPLKPQ